jgi:hypothetical protein
MTIRLHCSIAIDGDGVERPGPGMAPTAFRIWRAGLNQTDHGPTVFSARSAQALMREQELRGNLISFDIDHMSLDPRAPLENHAAVGWHRLGVRGPGDEPELWAEDCKFDAMIAEGMAADPPRWRYYSPAYDVTDDTHEVISYVNCAITNQPATWNVTQLATRAEQKGQKMAISKADMLAFIKRASESGGEDAGEICAAILAVLEEEPVKQDEPEDKEPVEQDEPKDEDKEPAKEARTDSRVISLLEALEADRKRISAERAAEKVAAERASLLASRTIANVEVRAWLASPKTPIEEVRAACKVLPPAEMPNPAAAVSVQATRGASQGSTRSVEPSVADAIDAKMGIRGAKPSIRREDKVHVLGALYGREGREEAKRILALREPGKDGV